MLTPPRLCARLQSLAPRVYVYTNIHTTCSRTLLFVFIIVFFFLLRLADFIIVHVLLGAGRGSGTGVVSPSGRGGGVSAWRLSPVWRLAADAKSPACVTWHSQSPSVPLLRWPAARTHPQIIYEPGAADGLRKRSARNAGSIDPFSSARTPAPPRFVRSTANSQSLQYFACVQYITVQLSVCMCVRRRSRTNTL